MKSPQTKEFYEFNGFRLDAENRLLWRDEKLISLTIKEFELLLALVQNAGNAVGKDELLDAIWKDTFVAEGTLTRNVSWLRKKLAENAGESGEEFIETLPKRGYRFLPAVTRVENGENITSDANTIVVEEQTLRRIRVEETVTLAAPTAESETYAVAENRLNSSNESKINPVLALPPARNSPRSSKVLIVSLALGLTALMLVGFFVYQNYSRKTPAKNILATKVAAFSGLPGREEMPAFSPDGKQIAFAWNGGDRQNLDVYVKLIGAGEPVRLTGGNHDSLYPIFSPDGRRVAFSRSFPEKTEIYEIPALGGAERKICAVQSGGTSFSWSPDGTTIAVADRVAPDSANTATAIHFVDVATGAKQKMTAPPENIKDVSPRFSPDGKSIVFVRTLENYEQDLYVAPISGETEPRRLTFDGSRILGLGWSASGDRVIFNSKRSKSSNLWQIDPHGGEPEFLAVNAKNPSNLTVSPDGKSIAYVELFKEFNVWRFDGDAGSNLYASPKFISYLRRDASPQISPDGSKIVSGSDLLGSTEIWIADKNGQNQRQLTDTGGQAGSPRFSPDGKFVAYDFNRDNSRDICVVSIENGVSQCLTAGAAHDVLPAWSADGKTIYFSSNRTGKFQLFKIPASGGDTVQITEQGAFESLAAPDGKTIYYLKENGTAGLWRAAANGGSEEKVPGLDEIKNWRSWSIAVNGVYFVADADNAAFKIKFYDFAAKQVKEARTIEKTPVWIFPGLSVSSDSATILYTHQDQNASSIMIAEFSN